MFRFIWIYVAAWVIAKVLQATGESIAKKRASGSGGAASAETGGGFLSTIYHIIAGGDSNETVDYTTRAHMGQGNREAAEMYYGHNKREPYDRLIKVGLFINIALAVLFIYPQYFYPPDWMFMLIGYLPFGQYPFRFAVSLPYIILEMFRVDYYSQGVEMILVYLPQGYVASCLIMQIIGTIKLFGSRSKLGAKMVMISSALLVTPGVVAFIGAVWAMQVVKGAKPDDRGGSSGSQNYYEADRLRDKRDTEGYIKEY